MKRKNAVIPLIEVSVISPLVEQKIIVKAIVLA